MCAPRNTRYKFERAAPLRTVLSWISWSLQAAKGKLFLEQRGENGARNALNHAFYDSQFNEDIKESHVCAVCTFVLAPAANIDFTFLILSVNVINGPISSLIDWPAIA